MEYKRVLKRWLQAIAALMAIVIAALCMLAYVATLNYRANKTDKERQDRFEQLFEARGNYLRFVSDRCMRPLTEDEKKRLDDLGRWAQMP